MKPYVYIIQNKEQTHWYVGMRSANECPANEDTKYWGSSSYLDELIEQSGKENWTKTIIKEFETKHDANEFEQLMIEFMWDWPGRVNKNINGYVDMSDPEVKAKHKAAMVAVHQDPEFRANREAMYQDPVYRANQKAATAVANKKKAKPFIATNIITGEEFFCESGVCEQVQALGLTQGGISAFLRGTYPCPNYKGFTFRYAN